MCHFSEENEFLTVCYFADWTQFRRGKGHLAPEDIQHQHCTHIIYVFALLDEDTKDEMVPGEPTIDLEESEKLQKKKLSSLVVLQNQD